MSAIDLSIFLTSYSFVVACATMLEFLGSRRISALITAFVALAILSGSTAVGFYLKPGTNYLGLLYFLIAERDFSAAVSVGLGVLTAIPWMSRFADSSPIRSPGTRAQIVGRWVATIVFCASLIGVGICGQAFIWKEIRGTKRDPAVRMHFPGFVIEKIAHLDFSPIRIATSKSGNVYVTYDYFEEAGTMGGGILELSPDNATGKFNKKIVADSPLLMRCYGLATRDGDLYVSRSGISSHATQGRVDYVNTGAVTRLRDIDGDGYFEFAHDIVTGLPGARGPVTMHQNNGIAFGPDGSLFVTSASAGNRTLSGNAWEGVVLRISADFKQTEIFAKGFRNPFGIMFGPDNELFVTDNDVDENPGDEIDHVLREAHYGHPYVVPNESSVVPVGFRDPILVGGVESNLLGMAYATSKNLPDDYRDRIYLTDFMQNEIRRLKLEKNGDTYKVIADEPFATIASPIDIAVSPSGEFFVVSRNTRNIYRIRPRKVANGSPSG